MSNCDEGIADIRLVSGGIGQGLERSEAGSQRRASCCHSGIRLIPGSRNQYPTLTSAQNETNTIKVLFGRDTQDHEIAAKKAQIDGWNGHTDGELALAKLRGPNGFSTSAGHQLLVDGMMNAVCTNCPLPICRECVPSYADSLR
jgi:hypothetical protein